MGKCQSRLWNATSQNTSVSFQKPLQHVFHAPTKKMPSNCILVNCPIHCRRTCLFDRSTVPLCHPLWNFGLCHFRSRRISSRRAPPHLGDAHFSRQVRARACGSLLAARLHLPRAIWKQQTHHHLLGSNREIWQQRSRPVHVQIPANSNATRQPHMSRILHMGAGMRVRARAEKRGSRRGQA